MDNFQQTVDLRGEMERKKRAALNKRNSGQLEQIFEPAEDAKPDLKKINRPEAKEVPAKMIKFAVLSLAILLAAATFYFLFFRSSKSAALPKAADWYAVKLVDGEIFYGQIADVKTDPVVMANVYYNYDQAKQSDDKNNSKTIEETGNIRLVKRGKETHGPDGSLNIVRAQILFMEPLKPDSKVLKAILEYEK